MKTLRFKKICLTLLIMLLFLTDCSDRALDLTNPNQLGSDLFWRTGDDAEKGLVGSYGPLTTIPAWGRMMGAILTIHRSDVVNPYAQPAVNDVGNFTVLTTDGRVLEGWSEINAIVARTNDVLFNVPNIEMDEARKSEILGEAYYLRAFAHFYLQNMWGYIPLTLEPIRTLEDILVEQAEPEAVWASIISDLTEAQKRLPKVGRDVGRATWGAATAMLGKSYLYTKQWAPAAAEFKKLIDEANNTGLYDLMDNYQDNFMKETNNNIESVFELQYESTPNGNWGSSGTANPLRGQGWEPDVAPQGFTSQGSVSINKWAFDLFMEEETISGDIDPRSFATFLWNYPGAKVYQKNFAEAFSGDDLNRIWVRKYLNFERESALSPGSWGYSNNNFRVIRFADVLLMYAEAETEANQAATAAAYEAINRVRARVNLNEVTPGLGYADMIKAIRRERVLELSLEGSRFFDLLRWGIAADVFEQHPEYRSNSGGKFERGKSEYLPIPQNDINTNTKLKQWYERP